MPINNIMKAGQPGISCMRGFGSSPENEKQIRRMPKVGSNLSRTAGTMPLGQRGKRCYLKARSRSPGETCELWKRVVQSRGVVIVKRSCSYSDQISRKQARSREGGDLIHYIYRVQPAVKHPSGFDDCATWQILYSCSLVIHLTITQPPRSKEFW